MKTKELLLIMCFAMLVNLSATTKITWWHSMGGKHGIVVNKMAKDYNESQSTYEVVPVFKGGYEETMTAGIAAYRAKKSPDRATCKFTKKLII